MYLYFTDQRSYDAVTTPLLHIVPVSDNYLLF